MTSVVTALQGKLVMVIRYTLQYVTDLWLMSYDVNYFPSFQTWLICSFEFKHLLPNVPTHPSGSDSFKIVWRYQRCTVLYRTRTMSCVTLRCMSGVWHDTSLVKFVNMLAVLDHNYPVSQKWERSRNTCALRVGRYPLNVGSRSDLLRHLVKLGRESPKRSQTSRCI